MRSWLRRLRTYDGLCRAILGGGRLSASAWIRTALHEGPSEAAWTTLVQNLGAVPPDKLSSVRGLAQRRAGAWPSELRRAPPRLWASPAPGLELVRALRVATTSLAELAWDHPRLRQLAHLDVELSALGPEAESFFGSVRLSGLSELGLGGPAPLGFELSRVWENEFPRLRRLRLRGIDLGAVDLRLPLRVTRALDELHLESVAGTGAAWDRLSQMLRAEHPSVLGLNHLGAEEEHVVRLAASEVFARVVSLSLRGLLTDRVARALDFSLDTDGLLELDLSQARISDDGLARFFTRGLFPVTESLHLSGLPGGVRLRGLHAGSFPALRHLDLVETALAGTAPWMEDPGLLARLQSLGVNGGPWADGLADGSMPALRYLRVPGVEGPALARLAAAAPGLRRLEAPGARPSLGAWAAALHGPQLKHVDLGGSTGGDDLAALVGRKTLQSLRWEGPRLSRSGWAALAPAMTSLRTLDVGEAVMAPEDVAAWSEGGPRLHRLRWTGPMSDETVNALVGAGTLNGLVDLQLGRVSEAHARRLVEASPWLERITLRRLEPEAVRRLEASHPLVEWRFEGAGGYHSGA